MSPSQLLTRGRQLQQLSRAESTRKKYLHWWLAFAEFTVSVGWASNMVHVPIPISGDVMLMWIAFLSEKYAASTISISLAAISAVHSSHDITSPTLLRSVPLLATPSELYGRWNGRVPAPCGWSVPASRRSCALSCGYFGAAGGCGYAHTAAAAAAETYWKHGSSRTVPTPARSLLHTISRQAPLRYCSAHCSADTSSAVVTGSPSPPTTADTAEQDGGQLEELEAKVLHSAANLIAATIAEATDGGDLSTSIRSLTTVVTKAQEALVQARAQPQSVSE
jgi:hypothetical protein